MSKWTKFQKDPALFFKDMFIKHLTNHNLPDKKVEQKKVEQKKVEQKKVEQKKVEQKKVEQKKVEQKKELLLENNVNFTLPIKLLLHTGEKHGALSHLNIWLPYFEQVKVPYIVMVRHIEAYESFIEKYPHIPVVFAKNKKEVDIVMSRLMLLKASFYPSNTGNNLHLLFYSNVQHIFIGHGDSDKTASAHKFFRVYDANWVAGNAHIDRFKNAGFDAKGLLHIKVGRPNLYDVIKQSQTHWKRRFNGQLKLLYLPTWEGTFKEQDYSSLSHIIDNINKLNTIDNLSVSIKLHPFSGNREEKFLTIEEELRSNQLCNIIDKTQTVNQVIGESNIFICDISAVVSECLAGNGPIFIYIPKDKEIKISQSNMAYSDYCYEFSSPEELVEKVKSVIEGNDPLEKNRLKAMEYILNRKDTLNHKFIKELKKVVGA